MTKIHKKRFEEYYSKYLLEYLFPERFSYLKVLDKPDLQNADKNVGIEVTTAVQQVVKENDALFSKLLANKATREQREKSKNRIRQLGGKFYDEGYMFSWAGYRSLDNIYLSLEKKIKKLNEGGYTSFNEQDIFITDDNYIKDEELNIIYAKFKNIQSSFSSRFSSIFLYLHGGCLKEFDMIAESYRSYKLNNDEVSELVNMTELERRY